MTTIIGVRVGHIKGQGIAKAKGWGHCNAELDNTPVVPPLDTHQPFEANLPLATPQPTFLQI